MGVTRKHQCDNHLGSAETFRSLPYRPDEQISSHQLAKVSSERLHSRAPNPQLLILTFIPVLTLVIQKTNVFAVGALFIL